VDAERDDLLVVGAVEDPDLPALRERLGGVAPLDDELLGDPFASAHANPLPIMAVRTPLLLVAADDHRPATGPVASPGPGEMRRAGARCGEGGRGGKLTRRRW
jgi:hypothetical protein